MKQKRTIRQLLVMATMAIVMVFSIVIMLNIYNIQKIAQNSDYMYTNHTKTLGEIITIAQEYQGYRNYVRDLILYGFTNDESMQESSMQAMTKAKEKIFAALDSLQKASSTPEVITECQNLRQCIFNYEVIKEAINAKVESDDITGAIAVLKSDASVKSVAAIDNSVAKLVQLKLNLAYNRATVNNNLAKETILLSIVIFIFALIVAVVVIILLNRAIGKEISDKIKPIIESLQQIAQANESNSASIEEISAEVVTINQATQATASKSDTVFDVVRLLLENTAVIRKIADSTNLYSLNGAIEAARVGEKAKGFAVVVQEIRQLSTETDSKANEIDTLSNAANKELSELIVEIKAIAESLNRIDDATQSVASAIEEVTAMYSNISSMAQELQKSASKSK